MQPHSVLLPGVSGAFAALLLFGFASHPAQAADRVGVAAAVTPQATIKPPGGTTRTLKIGKSVVYNERIETSDSGVVQVLLLDGSTFMVGPKSSLVIDKFVYNPSSGTGELTATFSKGALRFVGGKLSKNEPGVKVKTPVGELSVRGGIFQGIVRNANQGVFAFVFGNRLSLTRAGRRYTLRETGKLFYVGGPGAPAIRPATQTDINLILAAVSGRSITTGARTYKVKGQAWPFFYGIQPSGSYPDQPFVKELYYSGAFNPGLTRVEPKVPNVNVPNINHRPHVNHVPPPTPPNRGPVITHVPGVTCPNC